MSIVCPLEDAAAHGFDTWEDVRRSLSSHGLVVNFSYTGGRLGVQFQGQTNLQTASADGSGHTVPTAVVL